MAQLLSTSDGSHTWSERYDRQLTDIFAIQDDIAQSIVAELCLKIDPGSKQLLPNRHAATSKRTIFSLRVASTPEKSGARAAKGYSILSRCD